MKKRLPKKASCLVDRPDAQTDLSSLDKLQEHFIHLYGRRNNIYLPGRTIRIEFFHRGVADLIDAIRKRVDKETIGVMFARLVSRIFCIAHGINNVSVAEGMMRKYPFGGCSHCHAVPCQCGEQRPEADLAWEANISLLKWGLKEWQNHLRKLYGERNKKMGLGYILTRLSGEVGEFISLEHEIPDKTIVKVELAYQLQLADSLAWTIAPANLLDIDLQNVAVKRYGNGCGACKKNPCNCKAHSFRQLTF
jgi:NTP pyrophosphatase (non-canonical NTP hydrolase)